MTAPFTFQTRNQMRAFIRLTLANMVYLESVGISMTNGPARQQAMRLLDLTKDDGPQTHADLINKLRKAAAETVSPEADAPTQTVIPGYGRVSPVTAEAIRSAARQVADLADGGAL